MERVALVDGTGLAYRAFHALPGSLRTRSGLPTNAAYGFAQMFRKLLAGKRPTRMAVVFDAAGPTFRHRADPSYKRHRPPMPPELVQQLPWIDRLVAAHDVPIVRVPGVEADDVIGTLCRQAVAAGHEVWVVSSDKDFAQLVGDRVRWFDSQREVVYDADRVRRRYGVRPERFVDWLALVGDASDGIEGVPGIGRQRAAELLKRSDLQGLLHSPPEGSTGELLRTHHDLALRSRALATIHTDLSLPLGVDDLVVPPPDPAKLNAIYTELEFFSLLSAEGMATHGAKRVEYFVIDSLQMAAGALEHETKTDEPVALHVLHDVPDAQRGQLLGLALSPRRGRAVYLPVSGPGGLGPAALTMYASWLASDAPKVVHGSKDAMVALARHDVALGGVVGDPQLGSFLVDPTRHLPHTLQQVARDVLHTALQPIGGLLGTGRSRKTFAELTVDRAGAWACHQADAAGACWTRIEQMLRDEGRLQYLVDIDLPLAAVLARMERVGIAADPDKLAELGRAYEADRAQLEEQAHELAGRSFVVGSHKQVGTVLFDELKLPVLQRTKTGYSTAAHVLQRLADQHPLVDVILQWRTVDKLINTYTEVLGKAVGPDGRIHPTYMATSASAGRILTTEPDLQRTPVKTDLSRPLRDTLIAAPGHRLVRADWSQLELRLLAHVSRDPVLLDAYRRGIDVHTRTAAHILQLDPAQVGPEEREIGKLVNFSTIYGQGAPALGHTLGVSPQRARRFIDEFFTLYAGVAAWRDRVLTQAYTDGYVDTLMGRRRYIPDLTRRDQADRAHGERIAINMPIQGSGADLCKVAMLTASRTLPEGAELVLEVYDELLVEAPVDRVDEARRALVAAMEGAASLAVPLKVSVGVGRTWGEAKG
jgi:DNA polymerase-1